MTNDEIRVEIALECDAIRDTLLAKNAAYGNSALDPLRVFAAELDRDAQLRVRIDDKLSRIARGREHGADDTLLDLIGYLILLRIARKLAATEDFR